MYGAGIIGLKRLVRRAFRSLRRFTTRAARDPASGYDLWSFTYDEENENVLLVVEDGLFEGLLGRVQVRGKSVIDVGCGTGRHWDKVLAQEPEELVGYDVSAGMLDRLKRKYPSAIVHVTGTHSLPHTRGESCDLVVSTLALSHFESARAAFDEWARVLRVGGEIVLTDFHPAAAAIAETTFAYGKRVVTIKNHVRSLAMLKAAAARSGLELVALREIVVDESMRHSYERARMRDDFDRMRGVPLLYGMHLRKPGPR
jgi:ubiquinone/menaquinone biosynthesis C-methylase UbiE